MSIEPVYPAEPSADLATHEICAEIEWLVTVEERAKSRLCDHLAELADRFDRHHPDLAAYASIYQFARVRFGMSVRRVRERVRIGRALRGLPLITRAFVGGELGYAKVREVTRVPELSEPSSDHEAVWLATATELSLRALERRVAEAAAVTRGKTPGQTAARSAGPSTVELRLYLSVAAWTLSERAMEGARQGNAWLLSDSEALEAVARDALARQAARGNAAGSPIERVGMTPGGHSIETGLSEGGATLLKLMSTQDCWHADELQAQCELGAADISCALTELELCGLVHNGLRGYQTVRPALQA